MRGTTIDRLSYILIENPDGMSLSEIVTELESVGWNSNSTDKENVVSTLIKTNNDIFNYKHGVYWVNTDMMIRTSPINFPEAFVIRMVDITRILKKRYQNNRIKLPTMHWENGDVMVSYGQSHNKYPLFQVIDVPEDKIKEAIKLSNDEIASIKPIKIKHNDKANTLDLVIEYMRKVGRPVHTKQIAVNLLNSGKWRTNNKVINGSIKSCIQQNPQYFEKTGPSTYKLVKINSNKRHKHSDNELEIIQEISEKYSIPITDFSELLDSLLPLRGTLDEIIKVSKECSIPPEKLIQLIPYGISLDSAKEIIDIINSNQ